MPDVQVDDKAINYLGRLCWQWQVEIVKPSISQLDNIVVVPGVFEDAEELRTTVTERVASLRKNLESIDKALGDIGNELINIASDYAKTDDDATITASELDKMIKQIKEDLPGFMK